MRYSIIIFLAFFGCSGDEKKTDSTRSFFSDSEKTVVQTELDVDMSRVDVEPRPLSDFEQRETETETVKRSKSIDTLMIDGDKTILDIMIFAQKVLEKKGLSEESKQIAKEATAYTAILTRTYGIRLEKVGDHEPLSDYIDEMYARIEELLGNDLMRITRLTDIKTINYTAPVVFQPRGTREDKWSIDEYRLHFVPFSGVVAYWSVFTTCAGITNGVGVVTFVCIVAGEESRQKIEKDFAPTASDFVYKEANL